MTNAKNPSTWWFFTDYENDPALKLCSPAAQGLWMRLLCIMARSPEPGVLMLGGFPAGRHDILPHLAADIGWSPEVINAGIEELLTSGTASLDRQKRIYNRRMKRDATLSRTRAEIGAKGAAVTNCKRWPKRVLGRQTVSKGVGPPSASSSLQAFHPPNHKPVQTDAAREADSVSEADRAKWQPRLDGYRPWEGVHTWGPWGLRPDSTGTPMFVPAGMLREWRAKAHEARQKAEAAIGIKGEQS